MWLLAMDQGGGVLVASLSLSIALPQPWLVSHV